MWAAKETEGLFEILGFKKATEGVFINMLISLFFYGICVN